MEMAANCIDHVIVALFYIQSWDSVVYSRNNMRMFKVSIKIYLTYFLLNVIYCWTHNTGYLAFLLEIKVGKVGDSTVWIVFHWK